MIYIVAFTLSILLMRRAEKLQMTRLCRLYLFLSATVLLFLATFRSENVGTDVLVYQKSAFIAAQKYGSLSAFFLSGSYHVVTLEPLYLLITYIASRFNSLAALFFLNELIVIVFTYLSIWFFRESISPSLSLSFFCFCYYLYTFSLIRQFIAVAIILYATTWMMRGGYMKSLILIGVACGFHVSAIFGFGIFLLFLISHGVFNQLYTRIIALAGVFISFFFRPIFIFLVSHISFLPERYISSSYLYSEGGYNFQISRIIYILLCILVLFLVQNYTIEEIKSYYFYMYMLLISLFGVVIGGQSKHIYRITLYTEIISIFIFPLATKLIRQTEENTLIFTIMEYAFMISYMVFLFVIRSGHGVWPYEFAAF